MAPLIHSFQASFYPLVDWNPLTREEYELAFEEQLEKHKAYQPARSSTVSAVGYSLKTTIVVNTIITVGSSHIQGTTGEENDMGSSQFQGTTAVRRN